MAARSLGGGVVGGGGGLVADWEVSAGLGVVGMGGGALPLGLTSEVSDGERCNFETSSRLRSSCELWENCSCCF